MGQIIDKCSQNQCVRHYQIPLNSLREKVEEVFGRIVQLRLFIAIRTPSLTFFLKLISIY